jgi:hypothetical protein
MRYPVTPTLSVDALHVRFTCVVEIGVAVDAVGVVGGVVSGGVRVVKVRSDD